MCMAVLVPLVLCVKTQPSPTPVCWRLIPADWRLLPRDEAQQGWCQHTDIGYFDWLQLIFTPCGDQIEDREDSQQSDPLYCQNCWSLTRTWVWYYDMLCLSPPPSPHITISNVHPAPSLPILNCLFLICDFWLDNLWLVSSWFVTWYLWLVSAIRELHVWY